jgi:predicted  nucleic acid-binding Zn-ribbon protein
MLEGDNVKQNVKPTAPRCGICKKLYSSKDDDGSGLCLQCRPASSQPLLLVKQQLKRTIMMEVGKKMMDDFDKEEMQDKAEIPIQTEEIPEQSETSSATDNVEAQVTIEPNSSELKIENIIEQGRYGVSNSQMIPAIKKAIAEASIEKLVLLKKTYFYTFDKSVRYLKKAEREFINTHNI